MFFCKERYQYTRDVWFLVLIAIFSYIIAVNLIGGEKPVDKVRHALSTIMSACQVITIVL
jgi:hypothetical protein